MVKKIRETEKALGNGRKKPTKSEEKNKKVARKSIIAKVDIPKNTKITKDMLIIKRPGIGIEPKYLDRIIGKIAQKDLKKDTLIKFGELK